METEQTMTPQPVSIPALLTLALIRQHYLPIGERTLFRLISSGRFPKADIGIGGKLRLWKRETIETWISRWSKTAGRD
jgi:predicted DNA-binding transcriptional regulator AlpA